MRAATYSQRRVGRGMSGRGLGAKCHCGKEGVVEELIMGKRSGFLCTLHSIEARGVWAGAIGVCEVVAA